MGRIAHSIIAIAVTLTAIALSACSRPSEPEREPITLDTLGITPDSIAADGFSLLLRDGKVLYKDSLLCRRIPVCTLDRLGDTENPEMWLEGGDSLLCMIFNRRLTLATPVTDKDSTIIPLRLWLGRSLTDPVGVADECRARLLYGQYVEPEFRGYSWPVVSGWAAWTLPVKTTGDINGDKRLNPAFRTAFKSIIDAEESASFDPSRALYRGIDLPFLKYFPQADFDAADYASSYSLRTNLEHILALSFITENDTRYDYRPRIDSMKVAIETLFRNPRRGCFNQLLYQQPYPITFDGIDNQALALGVITGCFSADASQMAVASSPVMISDDTHRGVAPYYPVNESISDEYAALCNALWAVAAARVANADAFALSYAATITDAIAHPQFIDMMQGATLRGLLGISVDSRGLSVNPFIPDRLAGPFTLHNFRYRDAILDISVTGHGNVISTVTIDGRVAKSPVIPSDMAGRHEMRITLIGDSKSRSEVAVADPVASPAIPQVDWCCYTAQLSGTESYAIYIDGCLWQITDDTTFDLSDTGWVGESNTLDFVSVAAVADNLTGFAAGPNFCYSADSLVTLPAGRFARPGTRVFKDKRLNKLHGREFVESTLYRNARITFEYDSPCACDAYLWFTYVDGLGIVNPGLRYSLRTLDINSKQYGVVVFPQLTPQYWHPSQKWWERTGTTQPIRVNINPGRNRITLTYYAPALSHLTPDTNILLPLTLNILH